MPEYKFELELQPLIPERGKDLVTLFGERGACGNCWCMWWRLKRTQFEKQKGEQNKEALGGLSIPEKFLVF